MKNTRTLLGVVAVVGLIGFVTVSCDNANNAAIYHTVSFDTGAGGSSVASVQVRDGHTVARPATNPTRAGYNFVNWYASAAGGSPFNFATQITADLTVFARWFAVSTGEDCGCDYCVDCEGAGCVCYTGCDYASCECGDCEGAGCECEDTGCEYAGCGCADCTGSDCFCDAVRIEIVRVDGGYFQMGYCPSGQSVTPIRTVTVSGFYMGVFPVTQGEWYDVMGTWPSFFTGTNAFDENWNVIDPATPVFNRRDLPVEQVSWFDAVEFANALSIQAGLEPAYTIDGTTVTRNRNANGYRLPTEAEWEFAARGGIVCQGNFVFSGSDDAGDVAWTSENSGRRTHEVGMLDSNALGLYDMSGNVWEWVWDWFGTYPAEDETNPEGAVSGASRVFRGGSFLDSSVFARSAVRPNFSPGVRVDDLGFRLVRP